LILHMSGMASASLWRRTIDGVLDGLASTDC
jgi:hypothetical protein